MKDIVDKKYNIKINLSSDYYKAFIFIEILDEDYVLKKNDIQKALADKNVIFGIDVNMIDKIIKDPSIAYDVEIANGIKHINGENAQIVYDVEMNNDTKPSLNEDGTVDFKNMNFVHLVEEGQCLAHKIPATKGQKGTTVTGKIIKPKDGKDIAFKFGKNVKLSEDEMSLIATCAGNAEFNDGKISVIEILEIRGDVGIKTGNITFNGKVIVDGNVTTGYFIKSNDSIEIKGIVESADLTAEGDIIISGGVMGNEKSTIISNGEIKSKYLDSCTCIAKGPIYANSIIHSTVTSDEHITASGKKGMILGGEIMAKNYIIAEKIGSELGVITKLNLGLTNELIQEYQETTDKIKDYRDNIDKLSKALKILSKQITETDNPRIHNLYHSTSSSLDDYTKAYKEIGVKFGQLNELFARLNNAFVQAKTVYPGVRVKIGHSLYNVKNRTDYVKIKKDGGEIVLLEGDLL